MPGSITATPTEICNSGVTPCTGLIDLTAVTTNEKYLTKIPKDPSAATTSSSGYEVSRSINNRITVNAPHAEEGKTISSTR